MALQAQAFGLLARTSYPAELLVRLQQVFTNALTLVATGQDRDLQGLTGTVDDYWLTIELKSATAFSAACMAGAVVGTSDDNLLRACSRFGHHAGLAIQVFNDLESIWLPEGQTDLQQGKVTLPLVYALQRDHPDRDELVYLVENNLLSDQAERVREIFDLVDARSFMLWAALKEREQALAALEPCPDDHGRAALSAIITGMFGDLETLAP
jgi:geranylgeranyl pyrophosphate synthase